MVAVGITLQAERRYLDLVAPLAIRFADYVEVAPETLWRVDEHGALAPNSYHRELLALLAAHPLEVVAHGVGLSLGSADPTDDARLQAWLARITADHAAFRFGWYTDHLGVTTLAGNSMLLPLAVPYLDTTASLVATRLAALQRVIPEVGFENAVHYFLLGDWLDEPAWMQRALRDEHQWLLLDLHNLWTMGQNLGIDPHEWLARVDLGRVIEIHVSGGTDSDPAWLPDRSTLRLDSHDHAVPEPVWALLDEVLPDCTSLRGATLERMEGSVTEDDEPELRAELLRLREAVHGRA